MPKLDDLGYARVSVTRDPLGTPDQDQAKGLYQKAGPPLRMVVIRIYVQTTQDETARLFTTIANAYRVVPLQALIEDDPSKLPAGQAGAAANRESPALSLGDQQQGFVTVRADSQGNGVWTDVYRFGTAVAVVQVLDSAGSDHDSLRRDIAQRVQTGLKR